MKIYTRTGDTGETALFGGGRVPKTDPRVEAYGTVDELNAFLGRAAAAVVAPGMRDRLALLQHDLFTIGANLATPPRADGTAHPHVPPLPLARIQEMEGWIDEADQELTPLRAFILPGGTPGAAELHVCRTVCRRAERVVVGLARTLSSAAAPTGEGDLAGVIRYLNRLSDLLFTLARLENHHAGAPDVEWHKEDG